MKQNQAEQAELALASKEISKLEAIGSSCIIGGNWTCAFFSFLKAHRLAERDLAEGMKVGIAHQRAALNLAVIMILVQRETSNVVASDSCFLHWRIDRIYHHGLHLFGDRLQSGAAARCLIIIIGYLFFLFHP